MEFRNVSRLLIYLSLSLFSPPVTIKSKVFDTKNKKKKGYIPSWDASIAFSGYFCCSILSPSNCCTLDRTTRIERDAVKMRLGGLFVIMGRESNARATRLPSRHFRAGGSSGFLSSGGRVESESCGRCNEFPSTISRGAA